MSANEQNSNENTSGPMSKKDVEQSPDQKTDQDFPGFPHHPAKEGMLDKRTGLHDVDAGVEESGTGANKSGMNQRFSPAATENTPAAHSTEANNPATDSNNLNELNSKEEEIGLPQNKSNEDLP